MAEETPKDSSINVEKLSIQPDKPNEIVKSENKGTFMLIIFFHENLILVDILLNAAGNAPIMKQRKWTVDWQKDINWVSKFIHKYLKLDQEEKIVSDKG